MFFFGHNDVNVDISEKGPGELWCIQGKSTDGSFSVKMDLIERVDTDAHIYVRVYVDKHPSDVEQGTFLTKATGVVCSVDAVKKRVIVSCGGMRFDFESDFGHVDIQVNARVWIVVGKTIIQ